MTLRLFHLLLFVSGALALVYEVLWMRLFTAVFGATAPATAATLAAMFVGLAAGSAFFGTRAAQFARPLRGYGLLEMAAGLSALLVGPLLSLYDRLGPWLYSSLGQMPVALVAFKLLLALAALFLPSFCLGGTVPVLAQGLIGGRGQFGVVGSGLYAANTFGAAIGALSVPFFWLPKLGANGSYAICVGLNLLVGATAWLLDRRASTATAADGPLPTPRHKSPRPKQGSASGAWRLAALAALSGALMFILQVAWTRMFAQAHENSIYSFAVVVAVFILGLAAGAGAARALIGRGWRATELFGWAWLASGMAVFVVPQLFTELTHGLSYLAQPGGWFPYAGRLVWLAAATLFLPTALAGMALPLLMELAGHAESFTAGKSLGRLLAANTAGVVAGSLLAAFALPAWLGLWKTIAGVGIVMAVVGGTSFNERRGWRARPMVAAAFVVAGLLWWNPSGLPRAKVRADKNETLVSVMEGSHGIVAVVEQPGSRRIKLDNFYVLGGTASLGDERMQAHLPLLLHPAPSRVAFIGMGTGITAGAALLHPIERVTAIEIVPEVVTAARTHFAEPNLGLVGAMRSEVVVDDARGFLRHSGRQFDVIVGDLVVPWRRGESALYSAEHFSAARRALGSGGLFCQWLPMFQLSEEDFRIVTATFLDVFPRATLWRGDFAPDHPALALVGHPDSAALLDPAAVARRVREMTMDPANPQLTHEAALWIYLVGPLDAHAPRFASARRQHENHPWLELLSPLAHAAGRGERPVFVGRELEHLLGEIRGAARTDSALAALTSEHLNWREAGRELAEATQLISEGQRSEGQSRLHAAASRLPPELQRAFAPEANATPK